MRETIASMSDMYYAGFLKGDIYWDGSDWQAYQYEAEKLNYIKRCSWNAHTTGCWPQDDTINPVEASSAGFVLANGVTLAGTGNTSLNCNGFLLDWNGEKPPNTEGDDQIYLQVCFGTGKKGMVTASNSGSAAGRALYEWAFSQ